MNSWLVVPILLFAGSRAIAEQRDVSDLLEDVRGARIVELSIDPGAQPTRFRLVGSEKNFIVSIEVLQRDSTAPLQVIPVDMEEAPYRGANYFFARDVNCDGYADLHLLSWWGATGNVGYTIWKFDPRTSRFVLDGDLSQLSDPTVDCRTGEISTIMKAGLAGGEYEVGTYKYVGDEFRLIRRVRREYRQKDCSFVLTMEERQGDRLIPVSEESEKDEEWCRTSAAETVATPSVASPAATPSLGGIAPTPDAGG